MLVLPAVPYGVTRYGADFPGAVSISEETLRSLVTDIAANFDRIVLVNSHLEPEQVWLLRDLDLPLFDVTRRQVAERLTDEFRSGAGHAGRYETSLVLADHPELVHTDRARTLGPEADRHAGRDSRRADKLRRDGEWTRPTRARRPRRPSRRASRPSGCSRRCSSS